MSDNVYTGEDAERINKRYQAEDGDEIIKYMDFSKFMHLLINKTLYFCNVKNFEDKYEGKMPESFYTNWKEEYIVSHKRMQSIYDNKRSAYASCWNKFDKRESYALWRIYTNPETGVAIKTTVGNLKKALNNSKIEVYNVKYIKSFEERNEDLEVPFYFEENSFLRAKEVCKLDAYKYEDEVRALYYENSKEIGKKFNVNLHDLVDEIYYSPYSSSWFKDLICEIVTDKDYEIYNKIITSSKILI